MVMVMDIKNPNIIIIQLNFDSDDTIQSVVLGDSKQTCVDESMNDV